MADADRSGAAGSSAGPFPASGQIRGRAGRAAGEGAWAEAAVLGSAGTRSLGDRLSLGVILLSAFLIALMLGSGRFVLHRTLIGEALRNDRELTRLVSAQVAPALAADSQPEVWNALSGLFSRREILCARVTTCDGKVYSRLGDPPPSSVGADGTMPGLVRQGDLVWVREPLRSAGAETIGWLDLGFSLAGAKRAAERNTIFLFLGGLALLGIAAVAARAFSRRVSDPLDLLAQQVRTIGESGAVPAAAEPGSNELSRVAGAVHELSSRLQETRRQIEERNHELEETVAERTRELRRKNLALAIQNQQVLEVSRLKSDFLATMSHELRTPLNAILALSEMLRDGVTGPLHNEEQRRQIDMIHSSGQGLLRLINDVLDLSRAEAGKIDLHYVRTDLETLLRSAAGPLLPLAQAKALDLRLNLERGPRLWVDPDRVRQVFVNLLGNAIKFTDRGSIEVTSRIEPDGERLTVTVTDTGSGIAPQDHEKIFQEFRQLDPAATRKYGGTGLGLAICRRLVELMGGEISLKSDLGQGATFTFWVSALREKAAAPHPAAAGARGEAEESPVGAGSLADPTNVANPANAVGAAGSAVNPVNASDAANAAHRVGSADPVGPAKPAASAGSSPCPATGVEVTSALSAARRAASGRRDARGRVVPRVLVVDDDPITIEALERGFSREGFEVHTVQSGGDALDKIEAIRPDLMVLDLMMPGMSGFEVVERLAETPRTSRIPILVNTAKDLSREEWELLEGRVDRIFRKADGGVRTLVEEIHRLLDELQYAIDSRSGPSSDRDAA